MLYFSQEHSRQWFTVMLAADGTALRTLPEWTKQLSKPKQGFKFRKKQPQGTKETARRKITNTVL